ncbi:MAG: SusC/RagA family TonB-linked outer membrane protein [Pseudobacter sp.]|uniref:SusC/RagA family TonB-linked outer membrane protein n=1 Tax=Pseudobacter sp. TaxID=2045420 RepID=UPI003F7F53DD
MIATLYANRIRMFVSVSMHRYCFMLLLTGLLLGTTTAVSAQASRKVEMENMPVEKVLTSLEKLFNVRFFYSRSVINQTEKISIPAKERTLEEVLSLLDTRYNLLFRKDGNMIAVSKKNSTPTNKSNADLREIRGRVGLSESGRIYYAGGITVFVEGEKNGTVTDDKGYFSIKTGKQEASLVISFVGYETSHTDVTGNTFVSVTLKPAATVLSEVAVVSSGYQSLTKKNTTGSYGTISAKEVERRSSQSLDRILEGAVPGLTVYNGYTGTRTSRSQGVDIQIRGGSTIQAERNAPLIIVDGFEVTRLPDNMNEVEKIDILKDAAASSIWGSKAANGVIVITTKRGKEGKLNIGYASNLYFTERPDYSDLKRATAKDMTEWDKEAFDKGWLTSAIFKNSSSGYTPIYDAIFQFEDGLIGEDVMNRKLDSIGGMSNRSQVRDLLMRTGVRQNHYLSLSGGGPKYRFFLSSSFDDDKTNFIGEKSQSVQLNTRNDYELTSWLRLRGDINVAFDKDNAGIGLRSELLNLAPYQLLLDQNGNFLNDYNYFNKTENDRLVKLGFYDNGKNLLNEAGLANNVRKNFGVRTRLGFEVKLAKGLTFSNDFMYDKFKASNKNVISKNSFENRNYINQFITLGAGDVPTYNIPRGDILSLNESTTTNWANRFQVSYSNIFNGVHYLNLFGGAEIRKTITESFSNRKFGYDDDLLSWQPILNQAQLLNGGLTWWNGRALPRFDATAYDLFTYVDNRYLSYFSTAAYTFDERYTLTGSLRFDESNLFGTDAKYRRTPLWSIGGSWNINHESFFHSDAINTLKLRGTYGLGGNVDNSGTPFLVASKTYQALFNDYRLRQISYNPKLRWERTETVNIGIDLAMWNNRLQLTVDAYRKKGSDLLGTFVIDPTNGFTSSRINAATMTNNGFEAVITGNIIDQKEFKWTSRLVFGYNKNKVTSNKVSDGNPEINRVSGTTQYVEGYARETLWSYQWAGLDERGNPQVFNGKGEKVKIADISSLVASGTYRPPYSGGFTNTVTWKGWFASVFIVYNFGNVIRREMPSMNPYDFSTSLNYQVAKRWKQAGDEASTDIPGMPLSFDPGDFYDGRERLAQYSTNSVMPADFIRLREIQLGYTLPANLLKKTPFRHVQIIAQMNNVALWKKNSYGIDPEFADPMSGSLYLPQSRVQTLSLRVDL